MKSGIESQRLLPTISLSPLIVRRSHLLRLGERSCQFPALGKFGMYMQCRFHQSLKRAAHGNSLLLSVSFKTLLQQSKEPKGARRREYDWNMRPAAVVQSEPGSHRGTVYTVICIKARCRQHKGFAGQDCRPRSFCH